MVLSAHHLNFQLSCSDYMNFVLLLLCLIIESSQGFDLPGFLHCHLDFYFSFRKRSFAMDSDVAAVLDCEIHPASDSSWPASLADWVWIACWERTAALSLWTVFVLGICFVSVFVVGFVDFAESFFIFVHPGYEPSGVVADSLVAGFGCFAICSEVVAFGCLVLCLLMVRTI